MKIHRPSLSEVERIAQNFGLDLDDNDIQSFRDLMAGTLGSYDRLSELQTDQDQIGRKPNYYRPSDQENSLNAWYQKCEIREKKNGKLKDKTVVVKDNICVAGVPMMNGSSVLEGYIPDVDASVINRVLDAGATIVGKSVCENLCFSGGSHTNDTGPVKNPHDRSRSSGGSSSGSAALVSAGEVDMALGGDQGGSIRMPASWCGVVGHKPTFGLVPYTGAFPIEITLDHLGPITKNVADCALLLEVISGPDGVDPRQQSQTKKTSYLSTLNEPCKGMKIGVVKEGFGWEGLSEEGVDETVLQASTKFSKLGVQIENISVPMHRDGIHIWNAIAIEGATSLMIKGNGMGTNWKGKYNTGLLDAFSKGRLTRPNDLSETTKLVMLTGQYMTDHYQGRFYSIAQNLSRMLTKAYNEQLQNYDALLMPTMPIIATKIPNPNCAREEYIMRALEMINNTCPFDVTGHPAITIPCGLSDDMPVGMMLIGKNHDDKTILRLANAFEKIA